MKAVTGSRCPARWQWGLRRERKALVWESRERRRPGPLSSPGLAFAQAAAPRSRLGLGLRCRCLTPSASRPGLSASPRPFLAPPSSPRPPAAIPTLLGHQTLTCEVLDPGHGPLPTVPRSPRQQQQQSEEEKAQEAPGVRARGQGGHAQPRAGRQLWGNSSRRSGRRPSPHLPRPHLPRTNRRAPGSRSVWEGGAGGQFPFQKALRVSLPSPTRGTALACSRAPPSVGAQLFPSGLLLPTAPRLLTSLTEVLVPCSLPASLPGPRVQTTAPTPQGTSWGADARARSPTLLALSEPHTHPPPTDDPSRRTAAGAAACLPASAAAHPFPGLRPGGPPVSSHPSHLTYPRASHRAEPGVQTLGRRCHPRERSERGFPGPRGSGQRLNLAGSAVRPPRCPLL